MSSTRQTRTAAWGLVAVLALIAAALVVPPLTGWQVWARADPHPSLPPLHGFWQPKVGAGTIPALLLAVIALSGAFAVARRWSWRRLLVGGYVAGLCWMFALALVDGPSGISRVLGNPDEYLQTARSVTSVHELLQTYVSRIPFSAGDLHWPIHVAGHPPGMLLFFVGLVRLGLGGDFAAGAVVTVVAASIAPATMIAVRTLGREDTARASAPYLVFTPAAVFMAVSADAVMAAILAWGLVALTLAATRSARRGWPWAVLAGLLLGSAVMMSYGLPLAGLLALAVLVSARRWWPLPVAALAAAAVVGGFAVAGFAWWEAYPVLVRRYWDGLAARRPAAYWLWGDLAALAISAGPAIGSGVACLGAKLRRMSPNRLTDPAVLLPATALLAVLAADVSRMSKAEVERIWLPFVPWLTLSLALVPERWRRLALGVQLLTALLVQHLLYTSW